MMQSSKMRLLDAVASWRASAEAAELKLAKVEWELAVAKSREKAMRDAAEAFYRAAPDPAWLAAKMEGAPVEQSEAHDTYVMAMERLRAALAAGNVVKTSTIRI